MHKRRRYYLLLILIAGLVAVGDYLLIFRGGAVARLIENEIRKAFGDRVAFDAITAASDLRSFTAHGAKLLSTEARAFVEASGIEIRFNGPCDAVPRPPVGEVVIANARLRLSDRFMPDLNGFLRALRNGGGGMKGIPDILLKDGVASIDYPRIFSPEASEWALRGLRLSCLPAGDGYAIAGAVEHPDLGVWSIGGEYRMADNGGRIVFERPSFEIPDRVSRFFDPSIAARVDALRPKGTCSFSVTIPFSGPPSVEVRPVALAWQPPGISDRLMATGGAATILGNILELRDLVCAADDGEIVIRGTVDLGSDEIADLEIVGRRIPAEKVIAAAGALLRSPPRITLRGKVDLLWRMRKEKDRPASHRISFGLDEGSLVSGAVVIPLRAVRGDVIVTGGSVAIDNLRGSSEGATFAFAGTFGKGNAGWSLAIDTLEIHPQHLTILPPSIGGLATSVNLGGIVSGRMTCEKSGNDSERISIDVRITNGRTPGLLAFDGIVAAFRASATLEPDAWTMEGDLDIARMTVSGREIRGVTCGVRLENGAIRLRDLQALFCGGVLSGEGTIDVATGRFNGDVTARDLDLKSLAGSNTEKEIKGRMDIKMPAATFDIGNVRATIEGGGTVGFRDVYLWDVPIFFHMLNLNLFTFETKPVFRSGSLTFDAGDGKIQMSSIVFDGENINISGKGAIDFDGNLRMILNTRTKTLMTGIPGVGILENAIDMVKDNIYAIEIGGTFAHPEHKARLLPSLLPER